MKPTIQPNDLMTVSQTNIACANLAVAAQGEQLSTEHEKKLLIRNKPRKKIHKKYAIDRPTFIHIYIYMNVADIYDTKRMRNSNTRSNSRSNQI